MTDLSPMDELWAASAEVSGIKILSPAARAVLNAYRDKSWTPDKEDNGKYYKFSHKAGMAAALRAAADQVVPENTGFSYTKQDIRAALLAIADELEGAQ